MTSCKSVKGQNEIEKNKQKNSVTEHNIELQNDEKVMNLSTEKELNKNISSVRVNPYHPIVFSYKKDKDMFSDATFIGGSKDGKWFDINDFNIRCNNKDVEAQDFIGDNSLNGNKVKIDVIKGNEMFKFYSIERGFDEIIQISDEPTFYVSEASCQEELNIKFHPFTMDGKFLIGVNGEWNALPRSPKLLKDNKSFSIDVDSDGKDEIVRIMESESDSSMPVKVDLKIELEKDGKKTLIEKLKYVDPKYYSVLALDVNGDGKLEIIIQNRGAAGGIQIYQIIGDKVNKVLSYDSGE